MVLSVVLNKPPNDDDDDYDGNDEGSLVSFTKSIRRASRVGSAMVFNNILQRRGSSNSSGGVRNVGGRKDSFTRLCSCLLRENDLVSLDKFKLEQVGPPTYPIYESVDEYLISHIIHFVYQHTDASIGHPQPREQCHQVLPER